MGRTKDWVNVLVHADEEVTGFGRGGDADVIAGDLVPLLVGKDPRNIASLWDIMYESAWRYRGPNRAAMPSIGAVDVALWDLYGKVCGQPVWRLLGGYTDTVPAYADGIDFSDQSPETVAAKIESHQALGFNAFKLHFHP